MCYTTAVCVHITHYVGTGGTNSMQYSKEVEEMNRETISNILVFIIYLIMVVGLQKGLYALGSPQVVWFWDLLFKGFK